MRQRAWRWLFGVGAVAATGALTCGQGMANAVSVRGATPEGLVGQIAVTTPYVPPSRPLYVGERGAAVKSVQRRLAQLGYYPGAIDGVFGADLQTAAWAFREVQGMRMNATMAAEPITRTFERSLVNPRLPKVLKKNAGPNRVEINLAIQVLVLYKNNVPVLMLHVSTGGGYWFDGKNSCTPPAPNCVQAVTPDGNFHAVYFIPGLDIVPLGQMYNPVFFDPAAGDAIHGGDPDPWFPESHGCVRLPADAQNWFWKRLTIGGNHPTPVIVRGIAPYYL